MAPTESSDEASVVLSAFLNGPSSHDSSARQLRNVLYPDNVKFEPPRSRHIDLTSEEMADDSDQWRYTKGHPVLRMPTSPPSSGGTIDDFVRVESGGEPELGTDEDPSPSEAASERYHEDLATHDSARSRDHSRFPPELRALIEEWYTRHGCKQPSPCAMAASKTTHLFTHAKREPAIFRHVDGEVLDVSVHTLHEFDLSMQDNHVIVAMGTTKGPFLIKYIRYGLVKPVRFSIWLGLRSGGLHGFEVDASIEKLPSSVKNHSEILRRGNSTSASLYGPSSPAPIRTNNDLRPKQRSAIIPSSPPQSILPRSDDDENVSIAPGPLQDDHPVPEMLRNLINGWCRQKGPSYPITSLPCATTSNMMTLSRSAGGRSAIWQHKSGERLDATMYSIGEVENLSGKNLSNVIVVQGPTLGPFLVAHDPRGYRGSYSLYKIWLGIRGGKEGFEKSASVTKQYSGQGESQKESHTKLPARHPFVNEHGLSIGAVRHTEIVARARERKRGSSEVALPEQEKDAHPQPKQARTVDSTPVLPQKIASPEKLKAHLQNHVAFIFYPTSSLIPRLRLFSACDSVQKLFAQALAGGAFDFEKEVTRSRGGGGRVLSIRLGGGAFQKREDLLVVEDDEDDFEKMVTAIEESSWWTWQGLNVEGSGSAEVKALR